MMAVVFVFIVCLLLIGVLYLYIFLKPSFNSSQLILTIPEKGIKGNLPLPPTLTLPLPQDFGLAPLTDPERKDLLEVIEDRHGTSSTIVTSQLPVENWHEHIGNPTIADALLDRLIHNAHRISFYLPEVYVW